MSIKSVTISKYRGIVGPVDVGPFRPLTILVGPNNSGKSTCLEAVMLRNGMNEDVADALFRRRGGWLGRSSIEHAFTTSPNSATIKYHTSGGATQTSYTFKDLTKPRVHWHVQHPKGYVWGEAYFGIDGTPYVEGDPHPIQVDPRPTIIEPDWGYAPEELEYALSDVYRGGQTLHDRWVSALRVTSEHLRDVRALRASDGQWLVYGVYKENVVPLALAGDGMKRLCALAARLTTAEYMVLMEEPDRSHRGATLRKLAELVWEAVDRGVQVILTTHNFGFVQQLQNKCQDANDRPDKLSILELTLPESGQLMSQEVTDSPQLQMRMEELDV